MKDKKYRFGRIRWWQWVLLFIAVPIVMWVLMLIPTIPIDNLINETHWLSFFGGYIGACITGLITLYVLRLTSLYNTKNLKLTLKQNQANHIELVELQNTTNDKNEELNRNNREQNETLNRSQQQLQISTTLYTHEQANIESLKNILSKNYTMIDYQRFALAIKLIKGGMLDSALHELIRINRDIEMGGSISDFYISNSYGDGIETEYYECLRNKIIKYSTLVNDLIFVISLVLNLKSIGTFNIDDLHTYVRNGYDTAKNIASLNIYISKIYESNDNIYEDFLSISEKDNTQELINDMESVVAKRLQQVMELHIDKGELLEVSKKLLRHKEQQAKKILTEKLED